MHLLDVSMTFDANVKQWETQHAFTDLTRGSLFSNCHPMIQRILCPPSSTISDEIKSKEAKEAKETKLQTLSLPPSLTDLPSELLERPIRVHTMGNYTLEVTIWLDRIVPQRISETTNILWHFWLFTRKWIRT